MEAVKRRVKVSICGETYALVGDENEALIIQAAAHVDAMMRSICGAGVAQKENAAVLAALQCAIELLQIMAREKQQSELLQRLSFIVDRELQLS